MQGLCICTETIQECCAEDCLLHGIVILHLFVHASVLLGGPFSLSTRALRLLLDPTPAKTSARP